MKAVELKNVSFSYENTELVLENINFCANYGEITLICGSSGGGKSTIISLINGIIPNFINGEKNGDILIDNQNIAKLKISDIAKKVGTVLQNPEQQIVYQKVEDEIAFGLENLGINKNSILEKINVVSKLFNLDKNSYCHKLSGGEKQRLIMASTLAMGQKILLFDEPLANLDLSSIKTFIKIINALKKQNYAIIIVEHRLDMLINNVDKIYHLINRQLEIITDKENFLANNKRLIPSSNFPSNPKNLLISLKNLNFGYQKKEVLHDINLDIFQGDKIVLLGDNGSGKSTLFRLLAKLEIGDGEYNQYLINKKIKKGNHRWFKKVGLVYQNPDYQLCMKSVRDEIYYSAVNDEYAEKIIELFSLKTILDKHPLSLSQGQKRKITIASTLARNVDLLLLDEPTVGQDYDSLLNIVNILNSIHQETNNTMITITHDKRCMAALGDKVIILKDGYIDNYSSSEIINDYLNKNA